MERRCLPLGQLQLGDLVPGAHDRSGAPILEGAAGYSSLGAQDLKAGAIIDTTRARRNLDTTIRGLSCRQGPRSSCGIGTPRVRGDLVWRSHRA
jgi:hypothetical protein